MTFVSSTNTVRLKDCLRVTEGKAPGKIIRAFQSARMSLQIFFINLNTALTQFHCSRTRAKLFKEVIVRSENRGKTSESNKYLESSRKPYKFNDTGFGAVRSFSKNTGYGEFIPKIRGEGFCFGAVNYFIGNYIHDTQDVRKTAANFEGGFHLMEFFYKKCMKILNGMSCLMKILLAN